MKHLRELNETYVQHAAFALGSALQLLLIALVLVIHAVCPWWFTRTASTRLQTLLNQMKARYQ